MKTKFWHVRFVAVFLTELASVLGMVALAQSPFSQELDTKKNIEWQSAIADAAARSNIENEYGKLPLSFEPNLGQMPKQINFMSRGKAYDIYLLNHEVDLTFAKCPAQQLLSDCRSPFKNRIQRPITGARRSTLRLTFQAANPRAQILAMGKLPGQSNYFIGNDPSKWRTGVPSYERVQYRGLYKGIDLVFYGNPNQLEYDFHIAPNADPKQIELSMAGASTVRIDPQGNLMATFGDEEVTFRKPVVYQQGRHGHLVVDGQYFLTKIGTIKFRLGTYNRNEELTIDPVLEYSSYLGGSGEELALGIAVDAQGDAFVTGQTNSFDFPTTAQAFQAIDKSGTSGTIFVTEINPTGTEILYSTYLGGSSSDTSQSIALDSATPPNVYLTGILCSTDFPTTPNALLPTLTPAPCTSNGGGTAFVTKLNPAIAGIGALVYSSYLGGSGGNGSCTYQGDGGTAIAIDATGNIYVTGTTCSTDFPTTVGAFQTSNNGGGNYQNAFLSRIDPSQSGLRSLVYSTYLGGSSGDIAYGMTSDDSGNVLLTGTTGSLDFPTTPGAYAQGSPCTGQSACSGPAFVARINTRVSGPESLEYSTYLGGTVADSGIRVRVGPNGIVYVMGNTASPDFPVTTGAYSTSSPLAYVTFLSLFDTSKSGTSSLLYSTFLGGSQGKTDYGNGLAVDSSGNAFIGGYTFSPDFPTTPGAIQASFSGCATGFVSEISPKGNGSADLVYSTFLGGTEPAALCNGSTELSAPGVWALALDSSNNAYITGGTGATDFPVSPEGAFQTALNGITDAYVAKLSFGKEQERPVITSVSPDAGVAWTPVTISGSNFFTKRMRSKVIFGDAAAKITAWSPTAIVALVPPDASPGRVALTVHTSNGISNEEPFTVIPCITSVFPEYGEAGSEVIIRGNNLGPGGDVTFGGIKAPILRWSSSAIAVIVPRTAMSGAVVVTSNGMSSAAQTSFVVTRMPRTPRHPVNPGKAEADSQTYLN